MTHTEISKARSLFLSRGILNREVLKDEIVYSWVRSKLHNISIELLDEKIETSTVDISKLDVKASKVIKQIRNCNIDNSLIVLCNCDGKVLFKNKTSLNDINQVNCFSENFIGTNAIGISLNTNEDISVYGFEHYNKIFTNYVSSCLIIEDDKPENQTYLGIITPHRFEVLHFKTVDRLKTFVSQDKKVVEEVVTEVLVDEVQVNNKTEENSDSNECKVFTLSIIEKKTIKEALEYYHWNHKKAAIALGIGRSTLYRKIKEYEIEN